jgi:hypothetical protein
VRGLDAPRGLRIGGEPFARELAQQFVHREVSVAQHAQQRLVGERHQLRQRRAGDFQRGFAVERAAENRHPRKRLPFFQGQQADAVVQGRAQACVPRRRVARVGAQEIGIAPDLGEDIAAG